MSVRLMHLMCAALLAVLPHLMMQGCSSAQQEDGDLEGDQQYGEETGYEEGNSNEGDQYADEENIVNEGENIAYEGEDAGYEQGANYSQTDNSVLEGNQTKSDLEDIIAGQNADQPIADAAPVEETAPVDAAPVEQAYVAEASAPVAAESMAPALPEQGSKMPYIVRVGESLSAIAKKVYGNSERWSEIAELSSIKNHNLVRPGDVVYYQLSQETLAFATAYEGAPRTEVTVQAGDTLAGIAQRVYGNPGDWKFVWRQNSNITNPDRLEVGQTIYYLNPTTLGAALDYAKSLKIADLLKDTFNQSAQNQAQPDLDDAGTLDLNHSNTNSNVDTVSGFEFATSMFNFATAG